MITNRWHGTLGVAMFVAIASVAGALPARAAAFRNLDFEDAVIPQPPPLPPGSPLIDSSLAMPYWTLSPGFNVAYDTISLAAPCVSIHDGGNYDHYDTMRPLAGRYSIEIQDGISPVGDLYSAWISQVGDVPGSARSLTFLSDQQWRGDVVVTLNETVIPMSLYSVGATVNSNHGPIKTFIGDVSAFAGQENVQLRFEVPARASLSDCTIDSIAFSSIIAPEPGTLALFMVAVATVALSCAGRRKQKRNRRGDER